MKTHLKANKGTNGHSIYSICASRHTGSGKVNRNSRDTYRDIPPEYIVDFSAFKATPDKQRCAHCMDRGLKVRNMQRARNGKPPVKHIFDKGE